MSEPFPIPAAQAVETILSLEDEEALEAALASASPAVAAQAVNAARTLEQKTTLLWAMEDRQRREALEAVPPALVAALVQNLEEDNRYLLGDLSLEQFRAVLALCSPERRYYWIVTALSFTDARANALPLLIPTAEVAEILLTRSEFEAHLRTLGEYPMEDQRIPAEMMADPGQALLDFFGADNLLRQFPISAPDLAGILQTLLDYDPDRYVDLVREGLRLADYAENHPLEWETLTEEPVLLDPQDLTVPREAPVEETLTVEPPAGPPVWLAPLTAPPLARLTAALSPARQAGIADELQQLYVRQAVAEGGSFLMADLERVARSVEAYLLLGLDAESGGDSVQMQALLAGRPLHKLSESGARVVERLRQVALRLRPLEAVLDTGQRALVRSLASPRLSVAPGGTPQLALLPGGSLPEWAALETAAALLQEAAAWSLLARALGLERTAGVLRERGPVSRLLEELALSAVLYGRLEFGLAEPADRERFGRTYVRAGAASPEARQGLRRAVETGLHGVDPRLALPLLDGALDRLAASNPG